MGRGAEGPTLPSGGCATAAVCASHGCADKLTTECAWARLGCVLVWLALLLHAACMSRGTQRGLIARRACSHSSALPPGGAALLLLAALAALLPPRVAAQGTVAWPAQSAPTGKFQFCDATSQQTGSFTYAACTAACDASATCRAIVYGIGTGAPKSCYFSTATPCVLVNTVDVASGWSSYMKSYPNGADALVSGAYVTGCLDTLPFQNGYISVRYVRLSFGRLASPQMMMYTDAACTQGGVSMATRFGSCTNASSPSLAVLSSNRCLLGAAGLDTYGVLTTNSFSAGYMSTATVLHGASEALLSFTIGGANLDYRFVLRLPVPSATAYTLPGAATFATGCLDVQVSYVGSWGWAWRYLSVNVGTSFAGLYSDAACTTLVLTLANASLTGRSVTTGFGTMFQASNGLSLATSGVYYSAPYNAPVTMTLRLLFGGAAMAVASFVESPASAYGFVLRVPCAAGTIAAADGLSCVSPPPPPPSPPPIAYAATASVAYNKATSASSVYTAAGGTVALKLASPVRFQYSSAISYSSSCVCACPRSGCRLRVLTSAHHPFCIRRPGQHHHALRVLVRAERPVSVVPGGPGRALPAHRRAAVGALAAGVSPLKHLGVRVRCTAGHVRRDRQRAAERVVRLLFGGGGQHGRVSGGAVRRYWTLRGASGNQKQRRPRLLRAASLRRACAAAAVTATTAQPTEQLSAVHLHRQRHVRGATAGDCRGAAGGWRRRRRRLELRRRQRRLRGLQRLAARHAWRHHRRRRGCRRRGRP
jgi:hypothetical protein